MSSDTSRPGAAGAPRAVEPSYHFVGFVQTFEQTGFSRVGRAGSRRHVMRLQV